MSARRNDSGHDVRWLEKHKAPKKGENWNCSPRSVLDPQSYPENEFPADSQLSEQGHKGQICLLRG